MGLAPRCGDVRRSFRACRRFEVWIENPLASFNDECDEDDDDGDAVGANKDAGAVEVLVWG